MQAGSASNEPGIAAPQAPRRDFFDDYVSHDPSSTSVPSPTFLTTSTTAPRIGGHYTTTDRCADQIALLESLHSSTIGQYDMIQTPFGIRKLTYADYTASGRSLQSIEDYIQHEVLPVYANTHTSSNTTGLQSTLFRHEARDIIRRTCRASITEDSVIFSGSGATGAIHQAISILQLPEVVQYCKTHELPLPVVLVGPYEHHSNLLPWIESGAKVVTIAERFDEPIRFTPDQLFPLSQPQDQDSQSGSIPPTNILIDFATIFNQQIDHQIDHQTDSHQDTDNTVLLDDREQPTGLISHSHLKAVLSIVQNEYRSPLIITAFSAASNVTGKLEDTSALTAIAKQHGALVVFDYASAASATKVDMNPLNLDHLKKDIVFFSPHKFLGGVSTPGCLIVKNYLLSRRFKPQVTGGGTVFFVSPTNHVYLNNFHEREEGGTPDIVGSIRCGLVFKLKEQLDQQPAIRTNIIAKTVLNALIQHPFIQVIGHDLVSNAIYKKDKVQRVNETQYTGTISFLVYSTPVTSSPATATDTATASIGKILPPQFVSSLLNDLFGIQSRHGCLCAGPYSHSVLGIGQVESADLLSYLCDKREDQRPGVTRLSIHYSMPLYVIEYILKAILWVATHGVKLLPLYKCVLSSGEWKHHTRRTKEESRRWLNAIDFGAGPQHQHNLQVTSKRILMQIAIPFINPPSPAVPTSLSSPNNPFSFQPPVRTQIGDDYADCTQINTQLALNTARAEQLTLATHLIHAHHIIADTSCNFTTQTSTELTSTLTKWNDSNLLAYLYTQVDQAIASLQTTTFTTAHPTFNQSLPLQTNPSTLALSLDIKTSIGNTSPQQLQEYFTGSMNAAPKLSQLVLVISSIPAHPSDFPVWFPTPSQIYSSLSHHTVSPGSIRFEDDITPATLINLKYSILQAERCCPTIGILPIAPLHPGTVLENQCCEPISGQAVLTSTSMCDDDSTGNTTTTTTTTTTPKQAISASARLDQLYKTTCAFLDSAPSTIPQFDPLSRPTQITPPRVTILKPAWFTLQNDDLNLESLCLNCWHRHGGSNNISAHAHSKECVSCECVQFLPARSQRDSNQLPKPTGTPTTLPTLATQQIRTPVPKSADRPIACPTKVAHLDELSIKQQLIASGQESWENLTKKHQKALFRRVLGKTVSDAMIDFNMIRPGDRVLVGVSGGKDSLALIHALLEIKKTIPVPFTIAAATIDPMTADYDPSPLKDYFAELGVTYHYEQFPIMAKALEVQGTNTKFSICSFCSRMRRGILYSVCRKNNYNVLALGQHLDDFAESFVMSAFHNSSLNTMKPHYTNNSGDVRIIRPLAYTRESKTREFAKLKRLPIISENCPACFEAPKERARVKLMLAGQEVIHPGLYQSIGGAMKPLMHLGQYNTPEERATAMVKFLQTHHDFEDEGGDGNPAKNNHKSNNKNPKASHKKGNLNDQSTGPEHEQNAGQTLASTSTLTSATSTDPRNSLLTTSISPSTENSEPLAQTAGILHDASYNLLAVKAAQGGDDSGDEECAECVEVAGGGLACPIIKGVKRARPNPVNQDINMDNDSD